MEKFKNIKHFIKVWIEERWIGERTISSTLTDNVLVKDFDVEGTVYSFECSEYQYTVSSPRWYVPTRHYYTYEVVMTDGNRVTTATYPLMSSPYVKARKYWHHLAIRAHIQHYIR